MFGYQELVVQNLLLYYDYSTNSFSKVILKKTGREDRNLPLNFVHLKKQGDELLIVGFKDIFKYNTTTKSIIPVKITEHGVDLAFYCITHDTDSTWWLRILLTIFFVGIIGYLIFTYNRQLRLKARQQQDKLKLESLRGQMNPHFIFNSLNSINYFISQNDRLAANRYIADFAQLIRSILGNLSQDYIPLAKEFESLNDYLQLEHLRFGDKFDYEIIP